MRSTSRTKSLYITFYQNHPQFYLMSTNLANNFRIVIEEATLLLCQLSLNSAVVLGVEQTLKSGKEALYPLEESIFKTYTIPKGSHSTTIDGIFTNESPENAIIGFVDIAVHRFNAKITRKKHQLFQRHSVCYHKQVKLRCKNGVFYS